MDLVVVNVEIFKLCVAFETFQRLDRVLTKNKSLNSSKLYRKRRDFFLFAYLSVKNKRIKGRKIRYIVFR